ncbi:amino acid/amide ABC transporter ATP-binding protein 2 (HAAT family) [Stella humosa]|uniref:Amino acid/amide ABC transporter ATP-binding protein 2 (HAAT family) n=1 Tax=Stella humosa TaxID=94 RepID=A0A3N1KM36_9PROT|nr:ABC transporter ATP-binding protein [Stella humosa]ROP81404.1 amino acid/amide ABC transporter ATP-binding protein 2 (HAAT family) [Stella humosa]BBK32755.1 ABC transporter ATP-binding protein [Stella humosa]
MLKIEQVAVAYGAIDALHGISLQVGQGEVVALLGANGAGKTTLLRTISGLLRPKAGEIRFEGEALGRSSAESRVKRGIAHVPEGRRIFPGLTVMENLDVATTIWRRRGMSSAEDLATVFALFPRLQERAGQLGWSLSGGEQQMLAIGRALMARPKMLLLDEPSLGLAPRLSEEVYRRIADINAKGVTVLLVEQNTVLALEVAHRAYVIENGHIVLEGPARELARHPRVREAYLGA